MSLRELIGHVDLDTAIAEIEALIEDRKEFVYEQSRFQGPACLNFDPITDQGSCLIGQWLYSKGMRREHLRGESNGAGIRHLAARFHLDIDEDAVEFLSLVQKYQDQQFTWGYSVQTAKEDIRP